MLKGAWIATGRRIIRPARRIGSSVRLTHDRIHAQEWADRAGTIVYEILTGIGPRVPRRLSSAAE